MSELLNKLLPKNANKAYKGYKIAEMTFFIISIISIVRSLIHFLAPDGGAESIATIDLSIEGGNVIVGIFALWGVSQLLMGFVYFIVYLRYKSLIPFMYLLIIIEYTMRILVGIMKPIATEGIAPGAVANYIIIPLTVIMLFFSILQPKKNNYDDKNK